MSRHRYVRNLDLDAEMADDDSGEETGMSAEEQAQMKTALPIARALLKDVKPPILDDTIADSLWHYWFDVEKTVAWLRKDWEKKGESPPAHLEPTPDQQPRTRSLKRRASREPSPQPPLSALQRLSLSRRVASTNPTSSPPPAGREIQSSSPAPITNSGDVKPMSKLALLALKRKEAQSKGISIATPTPTQSPSKVSGPIDNDGDSPSSNVSTIKPLSKLAQKMALARAAKQEEAAAAAAQNEPDIRDLPPVHMDDIRAHTDVPVQSDEPHSDLFPSSVRSVSTSSPDTMKPSPFFAILTHTAATFDAAPNPSSLGSIHLPVVQYQSDLQRRIKEAFGEGVESPDEIVLKAREARGGMAEAVKGVQPVKAIATPKTAGRVGTVAKVAQQSTPKSASLPGKPRTQLVSSPSQAGTSRTKAASSGSQTPKTATPKVVASVSGAQHDLAGLHLSDEADEAEQERERERYREKQGLNMKQEELVAKVKKEEEDSGKKNISLIVVGHVDAGKSTLMGRLLYDLGELTEKEKTANERGSKRVGKGSFAFAWGLDALGDERDRGVTIDIATTHFSTTHRNVTLLDAPGHRDFIPAMISGAAQADVALMVVDGSPGEFEAGFERGGQTREHAWLVRSLGVREIIVGINKMDMVSWSQDRYDEIVDAMRPFLASAGFSAMKTIFMPIAAMEGTNVLENTSEELKAWYTGPTLVEALDKVEVPSRPYESPLRIPVSNVFKGQTAIASGVAVSGRLCSGIVQVGDRLRAVPGDEVANVRTIEVDDDSAPYAVAGQNVTLYLSGIDSIHLSIGTVLCPPHQPVPLVTRFIAQILVFDISTPIITGAAVELFHHSMNLPATISRLLSITEKGTVVKKNPRVLQKGVTASVELTLRATQGSNSGRAPSMPLETAVDNKEMGRVLIRRAGETIAAGVVMEIEA